MKVITYIQRSIMLMVICSLLVTFKSEGSDSFRNANQQGLRKSRQIGQQTQTRSKSAQARGQSSRSQQNQARSGQSQSRNQNKPRGQQVQTKKPVASREYGDAARYMIGSTEVIIVNGSNRPNIIDAHTEAIVNPTNPDLFHKTGISKDIANTAGNRLLEWSNKQKNKPVEGQALISPAFNLTKNGTKFIIHVVGPRLRKGSQPTDAQKILLEDAWENAIKIAKNNNIKTIAFPSISTGAYNYPVQEAAVTAALVLKDVVPSSGLKTIKLVLWKEDRDAYINAFNQVLQSDDISPVEDIVYVNKEVDFSMDRPKPGENMTSLPAEDIIDMEEEVVVPQPGDIEPTILIKPSLQDLEDRKQIGLEHERPTIGSTLVEQLLTEAQETFNPEMFKKEVNSLIAAYRSEMANSSKQFDRDKYSDQLDDLLMQAINNKSQINSFTMQYLRNATVNRAYIMIRNEPYASNKINPTTVVAATNLFDALMNNKIDIQRYKFLLNARVSLAAAANNPGIACNKASDWLNALDQYADAKDKKNAQSACRE